MLEDENQLDAAWERYLAALQLSRRLRPDEQAANRLEDRIDERIPYWAARPGQTAERIKRAMDQLQQFSADLAAGRQRNQSGLRRGDERVNLDPDDLKDGAGPTLQEIRMLRLGPLSSPGKPSCAAIEPGDDSRSRRSRTRPTALPSVNRVPMSFGLPRSALCQRTYLIQHALSTSRNGDRGHSPMRRFAQWRAAVRFDSASPRGVQDRPRRIAQDARRGRGLDLEKLPLDPYSGQPFRYQPQGLPQSIWTEAGLARLHPGISPPIDRSFGAQDHMCDMLARALWRQTNYFGRQFR